MQHQHANALTAQLSLSRPPYLSTQAADYKLPGKQQRLALRAETGISLKSRGVETNMDVLSETGEVVGSVPGKTIEIYRDDA